MFITVLAGLGNILSAAPKLLSLSPADTMGDEPPVETRKV
jgi:hypothetical protein